jgi:YidC/Oxa1 family membrane protein insertase
VNDRRLLAALALIMVIAFVPTFIIKRQTPSPPVASAKQDSLAPPVAAAPVTPVPTMTAGPDSASGPPVHEDTVVIRSKLYRYAISTRGGRIVSSRFLRYRSLAESDHRDTLELLPPGDAVLGGTLIAGGDTLRFDQIAFSASADSLNTTTGPATLSLHGESGAYRVDLTYAFSAVDYRINVTGRVTGLGPAGGTLLIGLGNGFRATEAIVGDNWGQSGVVTKFEKTNVTLFNRLKPRQVTTMSGPFEWVAVKSKYFVAGFFAYDSSASQGVKGKIGGVQAFAPDTAARPIRAQVAASLAVPADGAFQWSLYLGPMEYDRLSHMGRDFDDVNPYGWAWLRPIIRPIAVIIRTIFVWMHTALGLGYGLVIVIFGLMVRVLLWPLSRIAMRSMARMQAVQPELTALQAKYKDNPQQLQQETFKLYKQHQVNPFGGCWPMLLPYPVLVAVFFVLAYTIEVRGVTFLWMPDLARADPLYLIPILMAGSMFAVSKIGQLGLPPNPQTKMMTWMMPAMMLVFFARFAAGLNLYYAVQNLASIPQQWLVVKERMTMQGKMPASTVVTKKKA